MREIKKAPTLRIQIDHAELCEIVTESEPGGLTYALIRPDGHSEIFGRRSYLFEAMSRMLRKAVNESLEWQMENSDYIKQDIRLAS